MSVEVKMNFDLSKFSVKFSDEDMRAFADVIADDIKGHILTAQKIDGTGAMQPNAPSTIKRKGHSRVLQGGDADSPNLLFNQRKTKIINGYKIDIGPTRSKIGPYLHYGTEKIPARPFFGISQMAKRKVLKTAELIIERNIKHAGF